MNDNKDYFADMTDEELKDYFESNEADEYLCSQEFHDSKLLV